MLDLIIAQIQECLQLNTPNSRQLSSNNMDAITTLASSSLTITLSPVQLLVAASVLGVAFASNAKSVFFAWHVSYFSYR
jgi:hypothetical protein